jgi:small subunit ribosomal protein S9
MSVQYIWGTGRRKTSVARVRVKPGAGEFKVNGRGFDEFFQTDAVRAVAKGPLKATGAVDRFDVFANVSGGGPVGQAGAVRLGVARALL